MSLKNFTYTLADGESVKLNRVGRHIRCTSSTAPISVRPESKQGRTFDAFELENGLGVTYPEEFEKIEFTNNSGVSNTFEVYVSILVVQDSRLVLDSGSGAIQTKPATPTMAITTKAITTSAEVVAAAVSGNREIAIFPVDGDIWIKEGAVAVTTANGYPVLTGGPYITSTNQQILAISDSGASVDVRIVTESY